MNRAVLWLVIAVVAAAAALLRMPDLGSRPMHADEAVHAIKFRDVWQSRSYEYNPDEYHGPTIYYAALPIVAARGRADFAAVTEADLRLATALAGCLLALLPLALWRRLGAVPAGTGACLLAVSPALVYYSRYYIQEVPLALFSLAFLAAAWAFLRAPSVYRALGAGALAGLMVATKETAVVAFACAAAAAGATLAAERRSGRECPVGKNALPLAALAAGCALLTAFVILSGLLSHPGAAAGYWKTFTPWLQRAHSTDMHRHEWFYYLRAVAWWHEGRGPIWSEAAILLLGAVGAAGAWSRRGAEALGDRAGIARLFTGYGWLTCIAYSVIPYKTPWCALQFVAPLAIAAGLGVHVIAGRARWRHVAAAALAVVAIAHLGRLAYLTAFVYQTDGRNPWVYAMTAPDAAKLGERVVEIARTQAEGTAMVVQVVSVDEYYWPLPWYLRALKNVGYWTEVPNDLTAPVILSSSQLDEKLTPKLDPTHLMTGFYGLRPGAMFQVWVSMPAWTRYLEKRPKPIDQA